MTGLLSSLKTAIPAASREVDPDGARDRLYGVAQLATRMRTVLKNALALARDNPTSHTNVSTAAQQVLDAMDEAREARRDTDRSANTRADYARKVRRVEEAMEDEPGSLIDRLRMVMGRLGRNAQSFSAIRSALKISAADDLRTSVEALSLIKSDMLGVRANLTNAMAKELSFLASVIMLDRKQCLALAGMTPSRPKSKKQMLKYLPDDWRARVSNEVSASAEYGLPCALLDISGLRPVELEKGVHVTAVGDTVRIRILGGKVREHAGQPWRQFDVRRDALPPWVSKKLPSSGTLIVAADPENLRSYLGRVSERLFPRHQPPRKSDVLISPYVYRHAIVTDMRDAGWSSEDMAAVVGEASAATVAWYGLMNTGGRSGRPKKPSSVIIDRASVTSAREVSVRFDERSPAFVRTSAPNDGRPVMKR